MRIAPLTTAASGLAEENLRRFAALATHQVALRRGRSFPMWIGCGYPKSGTVWLCQLMANYLGAPYPQNYYSPVAMRAVVHAHWRWDPRLPASAYIVRDGRDVMVSFYFFHMRALGLEQDPSLRYRLRRTYDRIFGPGFDPADIRTNLPRFIEQTLTKGPATRGTPWHEHVRDWAGAERENVSVVRYEDLLADTPEVLADLMSRVTDEPPNHDRAQLAADRYSFRQTTGRSVGHEDRSSFHRKGVAGDWRNHFTREASEIFDSYAGEMLIRLGYEQDKSWHQPL